jgi:probable HAF family extracellular repeat protein
MLATLCWVAGSTLGPVTAIAQNFLTDLGAGMAVGMNNSGLVLFQNGTYSNGTLTALPAGFIGAAINASGEVVGQDAAGHAALYSGGVVTDLGGTDASYAIAINATGEVLGYTVPAGAPEQWFIYSGGVMTGFGSLPNMPPGSMGEGLNDLGQIIGGTASPEHIYIYDHGTFTDLGPGVGFAINAAGQATGSLPAPPNSLHQPAFLYSSGKITNLGGVPTGASGTGVSINASGQLVGDSFSNDYGAHAFLYNGVMNDLNSLIASTDPLQPYVTLNEAVAINDSGLILAIGLDSRVGGLHSYLLQAPPLNVSPGPLTFPSQAVGTVSAVQTETLTNVGSAPLILDGIATSPDFAQINNCGTTLAPRATCAIMVTYGPTGAGDLIGNLTITSPGGPVVLALAGSAPINVTISASAAMASTGTPVKLAWTISPGAACTKTGGSSTDGWTGGVAASGMQSVAEASAGTFHYGLSCTAGSQSASAQVPVIFSWPALSVSLTASPTTIASGNSTTLMWTSANAKTCIASGGGTDDGWAGTTRAISGSAAIAEPVVVASSLTLTYTLTCSNSGTGQSTPASVKVVLNPPAKSGGGGALDWIFVLFLTGIALRRYSIQCFPKLAAHAHYILIAHRRK